MELVHVMYEWIDVFRGPAYGRIGGSGARSDRSGIRVVQQVLKVVVSQPARLFVFVFKFCE